MAHFTKATLRALAYVHLTGVTPSHIQIQTWSEVYRACDRTSAGGYSVKPEHLTLVEGLPMVRAGRVLESLGLRAEKASHLARYIAYRDPGLGDERTGIVSSDGRYSLNRHERDPKDQRGRLWPAWRRTRISGRMR